MEKQMSQISIRARAKINLGLDVIGRLENGYHQVKMIMQSLELGDELTLEKLPCGIQLTSDSDALPTNEDNLICRAASLMLQKYDIRSGVRIHLKKRIPIAAGMAGGSTDAAATMLGICRLFDLKLSLEQLMTHAVSIGADVPYCLMGGTALAQGIGEKLTALPPMPDCHILVAKPALCVSTKSVYQQLDACLPEKHPDIDGMMEALRQENLQGVVSRLENILEAVTIPAHPVIADLKIRMRQLGAAGSLMSGSGPTVFGIFPISHRAEAEAAYRQLSLEKAAAQVFLTSPSPANIYSQF